jgi:AP-3 complex subunit mu
MMDSALTQTTAPFITPIPWRRPNVRYSNNEIYFDIEESMDAVIDRYVQSILKYS